MAAKEQTALPIGTQSFILSKLYYGALSKSLENISVERYYAVLLFIYNNKDCNQQIICNSLKIDKTAMVKVLDYLTKEGCIERKVNPGDRRHHFISLSKTGQKQTKEIIKSFNYIDKKAYLNISENDKKIFNKVIKAVSDNLAQLPANDLFFNYKKTKK
jgi:MarR family transcriptional regulator for hemolysin